MKRRALPRKGGAAVVSRLLLAGVIAGAAACSDSADVASTTIQTSPPTTTSTVPTTQTTSPPEPTENEHRAYVEEALEFAQETFYNTDEVDWEPIREWAYSIVEDNPTVEGAHEAVRFALAALDTFHTEFLPSGPSRDRGAGSREPPSGERLKGGIGYLHLPGITLPEQAPEYVDAVRQTMEQIDSDRPVCGWVLDLRDSTGGITRGDFLALGPLVGDDLLIRFGHADGVTQSVYYEDGTLRYEDPRFPEGEAEISWRVPDGSYVSEQVDVPVAVLISSQTGSAGEAAAIAFVGRPHTRFFGQQTGGATTASEFHEMPDGAVLRVSSGLYQDRTGQEYEHGLQPDTEVRSFTESRDRVLDAARAWLTGQTGCP